MNWKEVYELPLSTYDNTWVYDKDDHFVFEFNYENMAEELCEKILNKLNGVGDFKLEVYYDKKSQQIHVSESEWIILMRGWGRLTSPNCWGLSDADAMEVQDTFAQHIVEILSK